MVLGGIRTPQRKPRVLWAPERLVTRLSELAGLGLAAQKGLYEQPAQFSDPPFWVGLGIRATPPPVRSLLPHAPVKPQRIHVNHLLQMSMSQPLSQTGVQGRIVCPDLEVRTRPIASPKQRRTTQFFKQ